MANDEHVALLKQGVAALRGLPQNPFSTVSVKGGNARKEPMFSALPPITTDAPI
jgi:hypothetical protein